MAVTLTADKLLLYKFIVRQLHDDGFGPAAEVLATASGTRMDTALRKNFLASLVEVAQKGGTAVTSTPSATPAPVTNIAGEGGDPSTSSSSSSSSSAGNGKTNGASDSKMEDSPGVFGGSEVESNEPFARYDTRFVTTHKDACRVVAFSRDGTLAATGSADMSIKVLDVMKMHNHQQAKAGERIGEDYAASKPVLRTFYDHLGPINDIDFHPTMPIFGTCSKDNSVKFFDHEKLLVKRSVNHIVEPFNIRSIQFHPSGEYLISGGDNPYIRMFSLTTMKAFISRDVDKQHHMPINQVRYSPDGRHYASCGKDGTIKFWDGRSNTCVRTIGNAHTGEQVSSVQFNHDGTKLLSGGRDSYAKIWEVSTGLEVTSFKGCRHLNYRLQTTYAPDGVHVISSDERNFSAVAWDSRTGEKVREFGGHNKVILWIASSPTEESFMTASADFRCRFWAEESI